MAVWNREWTLIYANGLGLVVVGILFAIICVVTWGWIPTEAGARPLTHTAASRHAGFTHQRGLPNHRDPTP